MRLRLFGRNFYCPEWSKYVICIASISLLISFGFYISKKNGRKTLEEIPQEDSSAGNFLSSATAVFSSSPTDSTSAAHTPAPEINIYIIGEVVSAGVYSLNSGSLLVDAVEAAGGVTENADLDSVNLAYPLNNNMMIKIPSVNDTDKTWIIDKGNSLSVEPAPSEYNTGQPAEQKININTATVAQLCTLPGIGENTARKIIDYREANGLFENIYDLTKISGIKEAKYQQIKDYITVED